MRSLFLGTENAFHIEFSSIVAIYLGVCTSLLIFLCKTGMHSHSWERDTLMAINDRIGKYSSPQGSTSDGQKQFYFSPETQTDLARLTKRLESRCMFIMV